MLAATDTPNTLLYVGLGLIILAVIALATYADVTARIHANQAMREHEQRFHPELYPDSCIDNDLYAQAEMYDAEMYDQDEDDPFEGDATRGGAA